MTTEEKRDEAEIDEHDLLARARQGEMLAYDQLVRHYQGRIYALVYNMTSNKEDAEDLVQDVFVKAFTSATPGTGPGPGAATERTKPGSTPNGKVPR